MLWLFVESLAAYEMPFVESMLLIKQYAGPWKYWLVADHVLDWQPYLVDSYSCYACDHTYGLRLL